MALGPLEVACFPVPKTSSNTIIGLSDGWYPVKSFTRAQTKKKIGDLKNLIKAVNILVLPVFGRP